MGMKRRPIKSYDSTGAYSIFSSGSITANHLMGVKPDLYIFELECLTAENNYSVGDLVAVNVSNNSNGTAGKINSVTVDDTKFDIELSNTTNVFYGADKNTGAGVAMTNANWGLHIRAFKF